MLILVWVEAVACNNENTMRRRAAFHSTTIARASTDIAMRRYRSASATGNRESDKQTNCSIA